ncbi:MAG: phosphoglucomutase/phosphomannomutase family protein [Thermoanaerobaculia bacterium]
MTLPTLRFGTDGWRGVIAEDATFETFRRLAAAAAKLYGQGAFGPGDRSRIVVGHDTRFLSEEFAGVVAEIFSAAGIEVLLTDRPIPTPAVSLQVRRRGLSGGIAVTASHNPAPYNGFKLKAHYGGSAPPDLYEAVERSLDGPSPASRHRASISRTDFWSSYRSDLAGLVDVDAIRAAGIPVLVDAMHGAAGRLLEEILAPPEASGVRVETMRAERNVLFGGGHPEPIAANLSAASKRVREGKFALAVANDGDADRLGVLDSRGEFVSAHRVLALLILHVLRVRGLRGGIAKTFSTSLLIDRIASRLGVPLFETSIGFKYIADLLVSGRAVVGGEESGGYGFAFHLPERDGTLSALVLLENLAKTGRTLDAAVSELGEEFGRFEYSRRDVAWPLPAVRTFLQRVAAAPPRSVAGHRVTGCVEKDGVKLLFGGRGWLLLRRSGTEPMIRMYCEHEDRAACEEILDRAGQRLQRGSNVSSGEHR